jgi:hypothetical protein
MDPASLQKIRSQLDEFKHHLAEFEAAMAQGMADNSAVLQKPGAQFSTCSV